MIDGALIDTLTLRSGDFAARWKALIRKSPQLKHYNALDDGALIEADRPFYPLLARTLDRGLDRSLIGGFFVKLGKERVLDGFPLSEVIYGLNLAEEVVIEYLMTEFAPENTMRMYQSIGILTRVAEFFLLGSFYVTRGFLEKTYTRMSSHDQVSEELLKKYFTDDFFFKKE
ncbi:MAG: hypothetical protein LBD47_08035 [Treponema sp.]|jgi:hypothetical protein|nr:hypothetical protein [Treponema sp.]